MMPIPTWREVIRNEQSILSARRELRSILNLRPVQTVLNLRHERYHEPIERSMLHALPSSVVSHRAHMKARPSTSIVMCRPRPPMMSRTTLIEIGTATLFNDSNDLLNSAMALRTMWCRSGVKPTTMTLIKDSTRLLKLRGAITVTFLHGMLASEVLHSNDRLIRTFRHGRIEISSSCGSIPHSETCLLTIKAHGFVFPHNHMITHDQVSKVNCIMITYRIFPPSLLCKRLNMNTNVTFTILGMENLVFESLRFKTFTLLSHLTHISEPLNI